MKLAKGGAFRRHVKILSEDMSKSTNTGNYLISKLLNKSINKTIETETGENLGNFRTSVQNIFTNDENKKKAIQYVIKIRKEREKSPHNEIKHVLFNNKSEINITSKNFNNNRNIRTDLYNIYKGNTNNTNSGDYYSRNETTFNDSINVNKKYFETTNNASERYNNPNNIFLNGKNNYDNSHHRKTPSNNVLKNFQDYTLNNNNNNKKEKNYNMTKIKNKILNIKGIQENNFRRTLQYPPEQTHAQSQAKTQTQNQTMYNTQINFNYNTNKRYYVHKNLVYTKMNNNNQVIKVNNSNSKLILNPNKPKQKLTLINDNINNNLRNSNHIIKELKIFSEKNLAKINTNCFSIKNKKSIKNIIIKKQYKFNKEKLKHCFDNEVEIINKENKTKFNFTSEKEMFNYIINKYNEKKIKEIFKIKKEDEDYMKLKEENKKLKNDIENLKDENDQCKIELNDIRNQYNDINKELKIVKEENEKLKENFINNMIQEEDEDNINNNNSSIDE